MNKPMLNISLNPSYFCNFRCSFCYLTEEQLSSRETLCLDTLDKLLEELTGNFEIGHVDLYGGEVTLLPEAYLLDLKGVLVKHGIDDIVVVTNLSHVPDICHDPELVMSVSYDFTAREKSERVYQNLLCLGNPFTIISLASREFLDTVTPDDFVEFMNQFPLLMSAEIKPYSTNQANAHPVSNKEYEEFVYRVVTHPKRTFYLENETQLNEAIDGTRNAYSNDHIYVTPQGRLAVLEFDEGDKEYFLELDSVEDYLEWCEMERGRVEETHLCKTCPYLGNCLSEHLRDVTSLEDSCNGFRLLLDRWKDHVRKT